MSKPRGKSTTKSRDKGAKDKPDEANEEKESVLSFTILSKDDTDEVMKMSALEMESKLKETFQLNPLTDLKDAAVLDYYVGATYWGKEQGFTSPQLSSFFSVAYKLLHNIIDHHMTLVDLMKEYQKMLVGIGSDVPSDTEKGGLECFTTAQAKTITDYFYTSLFQHFKLYEFMFSQPQGEEIITSDLCVEVPMPAETPFPPPLDEGISEETYTNFLSIPTPSLSEMDESKLGDNADVKPLTPVEVELPPDMEDIFAKLTQEDVRNIIEEVSSEFLNNLQLGVENKLRTQENQVLARINKVHIVPPAQPSHTTSENK